MQRVFTKTVIASKLKEEIEAVVPGLVNNIVVKNGSTVVLYLNQEPTAVEDTTITATVNNHVPSVLGYKIWNFVQEPPATNTPPLDLDYKKQLTTRLHPKNTFVQGELTAREFYENASVNADGSITFSNLILRENNVYTRDVAGFAIYRTKTITWIRDDESDGPDTKVTLKYYSGVDKIQEGQTRRGNLVDALIMDSANLLLLAKTVARIGETGDSSYALTAEEIEVEIQKGRDLLTTYGDSFSAFISHSDKKILTDIQNDTTHAFLNDTLYGVTPSVTMRQYILNEMTLV